MNERVNKFLLAGDKTYAWNSLQKNSKRIQKT